MLIQAAGPMAFLENQFVVQLACLGNYLTSFYGVGFGPDGRRGGEGWVRLVWRFLRFVATVLKILLLLVVSHWLIWTDSVNKWDLALLSWPRFVTAAWWSNLMARNNLTSDILTLPATHFHNLPTFRSISKSFFVVRWSFLTTNSIEPEEIGNNDPG